MTHTRPASQRRPAHRPLVLAHRGASAYAPENTLEAFARARALGADGVELDVRRSADDVLVLHHDPEVDGFGCLRDRPFSEIRAAFPQIPTLAEALDELAGLLVNVEIKCLPTEPDHDPTGAVVDAVVALVLERGAQADVVISSFDLAAIDRVRTQYLGIETGFLFTGFGPTVAEANRLAGSHGHRWVHPMYQMLVADGAEALIAQAHTAGLLVNSWTLDDPDIARTLAAQGIDGIITNVPDVILAALG